MKRKNRAWRAMLMDAVPTLVVTGNRRDREHLRKKLEHRRFSRKKKFLHFLVPLSFLCIVSLRHTVSQSKTVCKPDTFFRQPTTAEEYVVLAWGKPPAGASVDRSEEEKVLAACGGERKQLKAQVGLLDTVGWARLSSFPLFLAGAKKLERGGGERYQI